MDPPSLDDAAARLRTVEMPDVLRERAPTRARLLVVSLSLVALDGLLTGVGVLSAGSGALLPLAVGVVALAAAAYLRANPGAVHGGRSVHRVDYVVLAAALLLVGLVRVAALAG